MYTRMAGEQFWGQLAALAGPSGEFGPQYIPKDEDIERSRQDTGTGWDQAVTMDRAPVDGFVNPISVLASPMGWQMNQDYTALNLERNTGNPSDLMSPQLRMDRLGNRFDSPLALIDWSQETAVIHSGGYDTQVRADLLPQTAKMYDDYYYGVIDGQAILDEAIARTRKAMYGR